jgi:hypothetical protein
MSPSPRRPGPLIVIGVALALVVAAVVVAIAGGDDVSPTAVRVDGTRTTSATLDPELDGFAQGDYFADIYQQQGLQFTGGPGSLSARGTAQWLSYRTQSQLAQRLLAQRGTPLTDDAVDEAEQNLADQGITAGMNRVAVDQLARFSASAEALIADLGSYDEYRAAMRRAARDASVHVDPKYARWSEAQLAFCVPAGCRLGGQSVVPPEQGTGG